ncbi:hypothetical protein AAG570_003327 [Ranatra chinensis]|uniref:DDRGK domain-containing protein 1 n=1 Tax=Ranatra chinensis TaxID=642074 RepID=A0ABD0Y6G7_9HEMI
MRAAAAQQQQGADVEDEDLEKMGAKKRAKMEAKAEKKAQREVEEREREEKKRKKEAEDEERRKAAEREQAIEAKREEDERKAKEERERREQEEYMKMKEAFNVEEEGYDANDQDQETLLCDFINYIKNNKVVLLEDLAAHFKLKTQDVISRIHDLQAAGTLTGVIDDRGKFIYVSQTELEGVAKFVKQRGRVSIAELAENSQRLIDLSPVVAST